MANFAIVGRKYTYQREYISKWESSCPMCGYKAIKVGHLIVKLDQPIEGVSRFDDKGFVFKYAHKSCVDQHNRWAEIHQGIREAGQINQAYQVSAK